MDVKSLLSVNPLPNDKILDWFKFKALADDRIYVTKKKNENCFGNGRNIVGKGENAGYQHFPLSQNVFKSLILQGRLKLGLSGKG